MASVRVLLADDHVRLLADLRTRLSKLFEIIGAVENGKQAVDAALLLSPDILVLDISMPVMNGFEAATLLRDLKCKTKIIILTTYEDDEYIDAAFSVGARAYVTKRHLVTDLVTAIREVVHGHTFVSPSLGRESLGR
jgi:DNA-binding NarL/FixJ family response regulator